MKRVLSTGMMPIKSNLWVVVNLSKKDKSPKLVINNQKHVNDACNINKSQF